MMGLRMELGLFSPLESRGLQHGAAVLRGSWEHAARPALREAKRPMWPKPLASHAMELEG